MIARSLKGLCWTKCPLLLLFFFYGRQVFGPDLFFSGSVKAIVRWLVASVVHHVDELDRKAIELRLGLQLLQLMIYGLLFLFKMLKTFIFEESLLVIQKFIEITLIHIIVGPF